MGKRNILIGLLALVICVFGWNCFGCKHEKTITRLVNDSAYEDISVTQIYTDLDTSDLREEYDRCFPRK